MAWEHTGALVQCVLLSVHVCVGDVPCPRCAMLSSKSRHHAVALHTAPAATTAHNC